jgi:aspartyl-tRNA(Asn)/glutamyl-tRNA(Gln) amidotransferase subunit A
LERPVAGLRVAWSPNLGFMQVDPEVRALCESAARAFEALGCSVEEASPQIGDPDWILALLYGGAQAGSHAARPAEHKAQMDPELVTYAEQAARISIVDYQRGVAARQEVVDVLRRCVVRVDLLRSPTLACPAFPLGQVNPDPVGGQQRTHLGWTLCYQFNWSGQPACSVPAGWTASGLPVGLQLVGRKLEDALVLRAAHAFEQAQPWAQKRPPLE